MFEADAEDELEDAIEVKLEADTVCTRLTNTTRNQYFCYLKQKLEENLRAWHLKEGGLCNGRSAAELSGCVQACAEQLERQALRACMVTQLYQKSMRKIIAEVRHSTNVSHLQHQLYSQISIMPKNIKNARGTCDVSSQASQTLTVVVPKAVDYTSLSLEQKISLFESRMNQEEKSVLPDHKDQIVADRKACYNRKRSLPAALTPRTRSSTPTQAPQPKTQATPAAVHPSIKKDMVDNLCNTITRPLSIEEDEVDKELAILFSEEKTELDEIFGFDTNKQPEDPQIIKILQEIENAKLPHELRNSPVTVLGSKVFNNPAAHGTDQDLTSCNTKNHVKAQVPLKGNTQKEPTDLRNSLWPCELFMQRRLLMEILNRMIEEDFRQHILIKNKFIKIFGEDSDDEFASWSPSIDLDEVLIESCVRRISPWVVKHLMRPLNEGLIANRFIFKKLAKKLAYDITAINQYPDEFQIENAIHEFFCLHQAVLSIDDIQDLELPIT